MSNVSVIAAVEALERADLTCADTAVCADLLRHVRRTRGWLDAVEARISSRVRDLSTVTPEASGPADTAVSDLHGSVGRTSTAEGRRRERRSKTLDEAPSFADALEHGKVSAEHVDALANATSGLDDAIKTELLADQDSLLAAACARTPEEFARVCRDRIRRLERDHGISRNSVTHAPQPKPQRSAAPGTATRPTRPRTSQHTRAAPGTTSATSQAPPRTRRGPTTLTGVEPWHAGRARYARSAMSDMIVASWKSFGV